MLLFYSPYRNFMTAELILHNEDRIYADVNSQKHTFCLYFRNLNTYFELYE